MVNRWWLLAWVVLLAACDDPLGSRQSLQSCPEGYQTCGGAQDCVSVCVCDRGDLAGCMDSCDEQGGGPYVSELDEGDWIEDWVAFEAEVLELTNEARAKGGCCGDEGCFDPSSPLALDERLRTSARAHARDMAENEYFDHMSQDGRSPFDRIREAGYRGCALGENIAAGQPTPARVMDDWLHSPGHCANILQPGFEQLGVGYYEAGPQKIWVQSFGG